MNIENLNIPDGALGVILGTTALLISLAYHGGKGAAWLHKRVSNRFYQKGVQDEARRKEDASVKQQLNALQKSVDDLRSEIKPAIAAIPPLATRIGIHDRQIDFLYNKLELTPPNQMNGEY